MIQVFDFDHIITSITYHMGVPLLECTLQKFLECKAISGHFTTPEINNPTPKSITPLQTLTAHSEWALGGSFKIFS